MINDQHILLVEDDESLQILIEKLLKNNNYIVSKANNISESEKLLKLFIFDLIILDVMLPDSTGLDFYRDHIKDRVNTPVIFLSALSNVDDRVTGLELGADDYIGKPFDSRELLLKIKKNILKKQSADTVKLGIDTEFDLKKEQLQFKGNKISLSSNEVKILKLLINNSHQFLTRDLLNNELGLDFLSRSGDMQISRLRLKLKKECNLDDLIRSVHGKGYKIFL
ncbi:MAG: response regulator transcription factor [alpha proteobacterium HIMB59]|nr:MAG: response regulator transcription factor [alpha proteobacterium HIMB59]